VYNRSVEAILLTRIPDWTRTGKFAFVVLKMSMTWNVLAGTLVRVDRRTVLVDAAGPQIRIESVVRDKGSVVSVWLLMDTTIYRV